MAKVGRPSKMNERTIAKLVEAIEIGATREVAARYAGISVSSFCSWMAKGREAESGEFSELLERIEGAEAKLEIFCLEKIQAHGEKDWRAKAWVLERIHPERWARIEKHKVEQDNTLTIIRKVVTDGAS